MDPSEPQVQDVGQDGAAGGDVDVEVLREFYAFLGSRASLGLGRGESTDAGDWMGPLARAGFADMADGYENLCLLEDSAGAYSEGLLDLIWQVGERLRSHEEPSRSLDSALEGWEAEDAPAGSEASMEVTREYDVPKLVMQLRVGSLDEKRRAATDLGDFLLRRRKLASEELYKLALDALVANRDPSIALEVTESLSSLGGSEAKRAKLTVERVEAFHAKLSVRIRHFWDGALQTDPVDDLTDSDLVTLGIWLRTAPDHIAGHLAEYMLARLGSDETGRLASVTSALVPSGDPRILPVLVRVLQDAGYEARVAAIKALAHIEDPRSLGALRKALRHADDALERVMIGRALTVFGDLSGRQDILDGIEESSPTFVREEALKAVGRLPGVDPVLVARVREIVEAPASALSLAGLRALSELGDVSTLEGLERLAGENAALRAAARRAAGDLRARLILRGEEGLAGPESELLPAPGRRPGILTRLRSVMWYLVGLLFVALRSWQRARRAAAAASRANASSAKGHFLEAYVWTQEGKDEAAIECFRRGLQVDALFPVRQWGEADRVLGAYLRHAESLERRHGKRDEAIALLEETEFIDLRNADPNLKIEVDRRLEALKLERRRERLAVEAS